jgi:hypothetical protein
MAVRDMCAGNVLGARRVQTPVQTSDCVPNGDHHPQRRDRPQLGTPIQFEEDLREAVRWLGGEVQAA